jgi:6-phosphogluconolactonase
MPAMSSRSAAAFFTILFLSMALGACGSGTKVCPAATSEGCCSGTAACPIQTAGFLYATGITGNVSSYPVLLNGALDVQSSSNTAPTKTLGMAALGRQFIYVSNFQTPEIDAWSISPGDGALSLVPGSPFTLAGLTLPAGLVTDSSAQVLYVADAGGIDAFKTDATGALSTLPGSPFPGGANLYLALDPSNRFLFASEDDLPGSVAAYAVDAAGALTPVAGSPFTTIPGFIGLTAPWPIAVDPTGSFVYTALTFDGQSAGSIAAFSIVSSSGALTPVPGSPFPAGTFPVSLVIAKNFLYVANIKDGTVSGYSIDTGSGVLTRLTGSPFSISGGALATDPSGNFLYVAGVSGIMAFTVNSSTGALAPIAGSPFPGGPATELTFVQ